MKHEALAEAILAGRDVSMTVAGKEVDVGMFKFLLRKAHPGVVFGVIEGMPYGIKQHIRIPASGQEQVRLHTVSVLDGCTLTVEIPKQPNHENSSPR